MPTLRVTVDWLDGVYHGDEWPPSPLRLYQAMIAGYAVHRRGDPVCEAAMRHLEKLPAPTIYAPEARKRVPVRSSVPNNDGDRVLDLFAKGKRADAFKKAREATTTRVRRSRSFEGVATYEWEATAETADHRAALEEIAGSVSAVGHGVDAAVARLELADRPMRAPGVGYRPSPMGWLRLAVPYPGVFDVLEDRYRRFRSRIGPNGIAGVPEPDHRREGYMSERDLPPRWKAFALKDMEGRPLSFEGTRAMAVAAMIRHAVGGAARRAGLERETVSELMGHGGGRRIRVHPLPNVGRGYADGRIRRAMLTAPEDVDDGDWLDVLHRLIGAELVPEGQTQPIGILTPVERQDPILAMYCGEAETWTTATPVVLPGHDHRRGRARPGRSVRRLLRHAGIPEAMVERATMEPAGRLRGSEAPARYDRPRHLAKLSLPAHVDSMEDAGGWAPLPRRGQRVRTRALPADGESSARCALVTAKKYGEPKAFGKHRQSNRLVSPVAIGERIRIDCSKGGIEIEEIIEA